MSDYFDKINKIIDKGVYGSSDLDEEATYLATMAPNIIEWVTGVEYWGVPSTFRFYRQYQLLRDLFNLRCKNCNDQSPEAINCWNKPRSWLEDEVLLVWSSRDSDFRCPKCGNTLKGFIMDGIIQPYNELITIAGMRSGKSYLGAHIGGYINHILCTMSMGGRQSIQRFLRQEKAEWFEVTFAASTATQAKETIYAKFREMRNNSPWMGRYTAWVREKEEQQLGGGVRDKWKYKALDDSIADGWQQVRYNRVSSNSAGIAGKTRIFAAIDELSRLSTTESKTSAAELYRVLNQSLKTVRSACDNYNLFPYFGLMVNVTSPMYIDDYGMQIYAKALNSGIKRTFHWKGATWEFNPEQRRENFDEEFAKDPIAAQRDYGADPPAAETPLINDPKRFWKSIDYNRSPIANFETIFITDKTGKKYVGARIKDLLYNFTDVHYIFCDAAETFDSFAMVCAHPVYLDGSAFQEEQRKDNQVILPESGMHITALPSAPDSPLRQGYKNLRMANWDPSKLGRLVTQYDFCMRIVPTIERDIWFNSILEIIKELNSKIKIGAVCFDQWQSVSSIQAIRDMGIQSFKVRLKSEHFMEFLSQAYNDQVSMLPPLEEDSFRMTEQGTLLIGKEEEYMSGPAVGLLEMFRLERSPDLKKVLAPEKGVVRGRGSDDIARCMVGANVIVKDSVVNNLANTGRQREIRKRLQATGADSHPKVFNPYALR